MTPQLNTTVALNANIVKLPLHANVLLVGKTESTHQLVLVLMDISKTDKWNVNHVTLIVLHVHNTPNVSFVLVTESMPQHVTVQSILITPKLLSVHLAQTLAKNAITTEIVLSVLLTEAQFQNVHVTLTISKLPSKTLFSVKSVTLDVVNVKISFTCVKIVLQDLSEPTHQSVHVQLVT